MHKFPFKNVIFLVIECKMYLKIQQKLCCLGCISKQTMRYAVKKTSSNFSKDDFLIKSFPFSTKRKLSILLNFLLKCRPLVLKSPDSDRAATIFFLNGIPH